MNLWAVCFILTMVWTPLYLTPSPSVRARGERGHRHQRVEAVVNTIQSFLLLLKIYLFIYFMCLSILLACMFVPCLCVWCLQWLEEGTGFTDSWEPPSVL